MFNEPLSQPLSTNISTIPPKNINKRDSVLTKIKILNVTLKAVVEWSHIVFAKDHRWDCII